MGKIRYAYDTASGGEIENKPNTGLAVDPTECNQGPEVRHDVVDPGERPGGIDLEPQEGAERRFYVYYLRRTDKADPLEPKKSQPFYVGKGCNYRYKSHREEAKQLLHKPGRKSIKITIVHKLWKQGLDFVEDIVFDNLTEQEAFEIEIQAIEAYGRINLGTGCLANLTDGGEGNHGAIRSDETKERMRDAKLGRKRPPFTDRHKENMRKALAGKGKGRKHKPESIEKCRQTKLGEKNHSFGKPAWNRGKKSSPETIEKNRQVRLGKHHPPETIEKLRIAGLGNTNAKGKSHRQSEESKEKISISLKRTNKLKRWDKIITDFIKRVK